MPTKAKAKAKRVMAKQANNEPKGRITHCYRMSESQKLDIGK